MKWIGAYLAILSGGCLGAVLGFLMIGRTADFILWPSWFAAVAMGLTVWKTQLADPAKPWEKPGIGGSFVLVCAALFILRTSLWLAWEQGGELRVGSVNNLGDFCLHLTHVRFLAGDVPFWPVNPISAAGPLTYPPGMAIWNLMLERAGLPVLGAFAFAALVGLGFGTAACWRWGGAFAVAALYFNGGMAGLAILESGVLDDYQSELAWKSIPLSILTTQRGFLYALPAGLWLLSRWRRCFVRGKRELTWLDWWIYATLPLFHLHTFIAMSVFLWLWFVVGIERKRLMIYVGMAAPVAAGLVWLVTGKFSAGSGLTWAVSWFASEGSSPWLALWENFGLWLILVPSLAIWLLGRCLLGKATAREKEAAAFVVPGVVLLVAMLFFKLQPWAWDNTKLMLWGWLAAVPFVWNLWLRPLHPAASVPLLMVLFASGFISLFGGLQSDRQGYAVASPYELSAAQHLRRHLKAEAPVAGAPDYNHPLLLSGQAMVLGYDGHLWSHGIDYRERWDHLDALMRGDAAWRAHADALGVRYLFWGTKEAERYPQSTQPWVGRATVVEGNEAGTLYRLR